MRHASGHNYRNSSFIVDVAMGQIPRSTERISSITMKCFHSQSYFKNKIVQFLPDSVDHSSSLNSNKLQVSDIFVLTTNSGLIFIIFIRQKQFSLSALD